MLEEILPFPEWRAALRHRRAWSPPWDGDHAGCTFFRADRDLSDELVRWLRRAGWLLYVYNSMGLECTALAPLTPIKSPPNCFHTTPLRHLRSIRAKGLLCGQDAGLSTSGRKHAAPFIHVSLNEADAEAWAKSHLLGQAHAGIEWAMLQVDAKTLPLIRDPASRTGYIVDADKVPATALTHLRSFRI